MHMVEISSAAQDYLRDLLAKQEAGCGIRMFVAQPGTPHAETCIAYCRPGEQQDDDVPIEYEGFTAWFETRSEPYLVDAVVDFQRWGTACHQPRNYRPISLTSLVVKIIENHCKETESLSW